MNRQQNVVKLIMIDLTPCMKQARNSRILKCFHNETSKGVVLNLVKQILYLSIYDMKSKKFIPFNLIPPIGEITNVILHLFYQKVFDKVIEEKYPSCSYADDVWFIFHNRRGGLDSLYRGEMCLSLDQIVIGL
jgi:hypothetical protein